ncbi:MAG: lamin tail domain-containing protein, partial [Planctomycetales bacterium]|nr:lamin tail domain-containing protein [Planctomycetales bacterium]
LLYEEFDRWGPDGVQNASPLEQVRLALGHDEILIEFQSRLREMQDLLLNPDQAWQAVEEYARHVERFADVDRAMWNYNPRTSAAHKGYFYKSPAPYDGGAAGQVRRALTSADFEGMINWVKEFIVDGGFGGSQLKVLHQDSDIPATPVVTALGTTSITDLLFRTSEFLDPQGADTFAALEWRVAEVTDAAAPAYDPDTPVHFEITPTWTSGRTELFSDTMVLDPAILQVGHAYRVRIRMQDTTGRWSHWSDPLQFIPAAATSSLHQALRISEVNYHPGAPTAGEIAAGYTDADEFEFIELVNRSTNPVDLRTAALVMSQDDMGEEGVYFSFANGAVQTLEAGGRVVVVEDIEAFRMRYGDEPRVAGQWTGQLSNASEQLTLIALGTIIQQFRYQD